MSRNCRFRTTRPFSTGRSGTWPTRRNLDVPFPSAFRRWPLQQLGGDFGITGVPSFGVAGRYLVVAKEAKTREDILATVDRVIEMARRAPAK